MQKLFYNYRKIFSFVLAMILAFTVACPAFAAEIATDNSDVLLHSEEERERKIDALLSQINVLALSKKMVEVRDMNVPKEIDRASTNRALAQIDEQTALLEKELVKLGVTKIDPNNEKHMQQLKTIVIEAVHNDPNSNMARSAGEPNLELLAARYSLYQWSGTYTIGDGQYDYTTIKVTDNKGTDGLTEIVVDRALTGKTSTTIGALVEQTCSFGFSQFLGTVPYGWVADWTLGAAFAFLESYTPNTTVTIAGGHTSLHHMTIMTVTQMQYFYINMPSMGWIACGTRASDIELSAHEVLALKVGSDPNVKGRDLPTVNSSTGWTVRQYLENYIATGNRADHTIGRLKVNGWNNTSFYIEPQYAMYPTTL